MHFKSQIITTKTLPALSRSNTAS